MRPDGESYVGSYVKVIHDFHTDLDGEVSLVKGEIFKVSKVIDKNWLCGASRDKSGHFPTDFVDKIHLPSVANGQKIFAAVENFQAQQTGDLNIAKGDVIIGLHQIDDNWWQGQNQGNMGMFPITHVIELEIPCQLKQRSMNVHATETLFAQALVAAKGQLDEELSFQAGDIIKVTEVIDEDWYVGECRGKSGMFLAACVQLLNEEECQQSAQKESSVSKHTGGSVSQNSNFKDQGGSFQTKSISTSIHSGYPGDISGSDKHLKTVPEGNYHKSGSLDRTTNLASYTSENTKAHVGDTEAGVTPYARTLYPFSGEMPGELSFEANEIVTLIQHVDEQWIEGEIDGIIGLFPATYVEVVVDCPYAFCFDDTCEENTQKSCDKDNNTYTTNKDEKSNELNVADNSAMPFMVNDKSVDLCESYALVLYTFAPETDADLGIQEGETVTVIKQVDDNWMLVCNEAGRTGMCPVTFLDVIGSPPSKHLHDTNDNEIKATKHTQSKKDAAITENVFKGVTLTQNSAIDSYNLNESDVNKSSASSNKSLSQTNLTKSAKPVLKPKPALTSKPALKPKPLLAPKPFNSSQSGTRPVSFDPAVTMPKSNSVRCLSEIISEKNGLQEGMYKAQSMYEIHNHSKKAASNIGSDCGSTGSNNSLNASFEPKKSSSESRKSFKDFDLSKPLDSIIKDELVKARKEAETKSKHGSTLSKESTGRGHFIYTSEMEQKTSQSRSSGNYSRENFEASLNVGNSTFYFDDASSTSTKPLQFRKPPPPPMKSQKSEVFIRKPSLKKPAPPRPVGPRIAPAPPKTPMVPEAVVQSQITASRPAPARPGPLPARPKSGAVRRDKPAPPRPGGKTAGSDLMSFSPPNSTFYVAEEVETEEILGLRSQISNIEKDIQSVGKSKAELEQRLADSAVDDTELHDNIQFYTDNILGLTSELTTLRERLAELCPQERNKIDEEKLVAARREQEIRQREEQKRREAEAKAERMEKRQRVIQELVQTERDFILSLSLIYETFLGPNAEKHPDMDVDHLCGNVEEVAEVSQKLLTRLEDATQGKDFNQTVIGTCFVALAEDMKNVYAPYCRNHDDVITLIEKYEAMAEVQAHIERQLDRLREDHTVFDLGALLIKPVQRILKYPLLLSELCKSTEEDHPDKTELVAAMNAMTDVAQAINEYKRRKDLVYKYKKETDVSLGDKLSKLSLHSIKKKSSRIKERFSVNLGFIDQTRDTLFEREETRYRHLEKSVRVFLRDMQSYVEEVQAMVNIQEGLSADIEDFYAEKRSTEEIHKYQVLCNTIHMTFLPNFQMEVDDLVSHPLTQLVTLFEGPDMVIQKRYDKLLDYDNLKRKAQSDKVFEKPMQTAKQNYEALNAQLLDDLPKMADLATQLFRDCVGSFVRAQREFTDKIVHEMYTVTEQQLEFLSDEGIVDQFNIRHTAIVDRLAQLSFMPRTFCPRVADAKQDKKNKRMSLDSNSPMLKSTEAVPQMDSQKVYVTQQYVGGKLFRVTETHIAQDPMDISVCGGDVVGVIMEKDPMGNKERWFVDNGAMKGFIPRKLLVSYQSSPPRPHTGSSPELNLRLSAGSCHYSPKRSPSPGHRTSGSVHTLQSLQELNDMDFALEEEMVPDIVDTGPPSYQSLIAGHQSMQLANISEYRPNEFNAGSQSTQAEDNAGYQHNAEGHYGSEDAGLEDLQLYYAEYPFEARNQNEVSMFEHQVVTVIAAHDENGNTEWWYVEADGHYGYAPASYLRPMDTHEQPA